MDIIAAYDLSDGTHVDVTVNPDPDFPERGDWRLTDGQGYDLAVSSHGTDFDDSEIFQYGDADLYALEQEWVDHESGNIPEPETPRPIMEMARVAAEQMNVYVYFPHDSLDNEVEREEIAQANANVLLGGIYVVTMRDSNGKVTAQFNLETSEIDPDVDEVIKGIADEDTILSVQEQHGHK